MCETEEKKKNRKIEKIIPLAKCGRRRGLKNTNVCAYEEKIYVVKLFVRVFNFRSLLLCTREVWGGGDPCF